MPSRQPPRALALLACAALLSGAAAAAGHGFQARAVTGAGTFSLLLQEATWAAAPPATGWEVEAPSIHVRVVDDRTVQRVPDPRGGDLYGEHNRTVVDATTTRLGLAGASPDALVLGLGAVTVPMPVRSQGLLSIASASAQVLAQSRAVPEAHGDYYEHLSAAGPTASLDLADLPLGNGTQLYVWGVNLTLADGSVIRTGEWVENAALEAQDIQALQPRPPGPRHHVHAIVEVRGAATSVQARQASLYGAALSISGSGDLLFHAAHGTLASGSATLHFDGDVALAGGAFRLSRDGAGLLAAPERAPDAYTGAVVVERPSPAPWLPAALLATGGAAAALYALPAVRGLFLVMRAPTRFPSHLRSEAYAHWASRAQMHDWVRLAVWLEGRAVHNAPTVGDFRTERAILLRQAGRLDEALAEHRRAHDLLASGPDGGYLALNAFQAALAGAEAGRDAEAVRWLEVAVEADRGLVAELRAHPTLRRLISHPDSGAVMP